MGTNPDERGLAEDVADDGGPFGGGLYVVASLPCGDRAEPAGLTEQARRRRRMAEGVADALVEPAYRLHGQGGHDWVEAALEVPLSYPPMWQAYHESFAVVEAAKQLPDEIQISEPFDGTGVVVLVHGLAWSVVARQVNGEPGLVFVCRDDIAEVPLVVELLPGEYADANRVAMWIVTMLMQVQRAGVGGGWVPPRAAAR